VSVVCMRRVSSCAPLRGCYRITDMTEPLSWCVPLQRYFIFNERKQVFTFVLGIFGDVLVNLYYGSIPPAVSAAAGAGEGLAAAPSQRSAPQPAHASKLSRTDGVKARVSEAS
jgi:hypothetical protein